MKTILVIDDDPSVRRTLEIHLEDEGYRVLTATDGPAGLRQADAADLVLLDLRLSGMDGFEILRILKSSHPALPVVVITAYDDMTTAIESMRLGAVDHLGKPVDMEHLNDVVARASCQSERAEGDLNFVSEGEHDDGPNAIVGKSLAMKEVFKSIGRVADSKATVLISGESGTGKELVARAIHYGGRLAAAPFVAVACSALAPTLLESELFGHEKGAFTGADARRTGRFEQAKGGTIFLDEISEVSPDIQVKLLRVLQEKEFERVGGIEKVEADVRIVAATNKDLEPLLKTARFREDLYYRLKVVTIRLPPLRDRMEDLPLLVGHFLSKIRRETGKVITVVPKRAFNLMAGHSWPGNVRELENALRRAALLSSGEVLNPDFLELAQLGEKSPLPLIVASLQEIEKMHIENILRFCRGEKKRTAELLKISRPTLDKKIGDMGIAAEPSKGRDG